MAAGSDFMTRTQSCSIRHKSGVDSKNYSTMISTPVVRRVNVVRSDSIHGIYQCTPAAKKICGSNHDGEITVKTTRMYKTSPRQVHNNIKLGSNVNIINLSESKYLNGQSTEKRYVTVSSKQQSPYRNFEKVAIKESVNRTIAYSAERQRTVTTISGKKNSTPSRSEIYIPSNMTDVSFKSKNCRTPTRKYSPPKLTPRCNTTPHLTRKDTSAPVPIRRFTTAENLVSSAYLSDPKTSIRELIPSLQKDLGLDSTPATNFKFTSCSAGGCCFAVWKLFIDGNQNRYSSSASRCIILKASMTRTEYPGANEITTFLNLLRSHPEISSDTSLSFPLKIYEVNSKTKLHIVVMNAAPGVSLTDLINEKLTQRLDHDIEKIFYLVGKQLKSFHQSYGHKKHGDFQTNNIFYCPVTNVVTFIDLGGIGGATRDNDQEHFVQCLKIFKKLYSKKMPYNEWVNSFRSGYRD